MSITLYREGADTGPHFKSDLKVGLTWPGWCSGCVAVCLMPWWLSAFRSPRVCIVTVMLLPHFMVLSSRPPMLRLLK